MLAHLSTASSTSFSGPALALLGVFDVEPGVLNHVVAGLGACCGLPETALPLYLQ